MALTAEVNCELTAYAIGKIFVVNPVQNMNAFTTDQRLPVFEVTLG